MCNFFIYQNKRYNIIEQSPLGQGGNWDVYSIVLKERIDINKITFFKIVIKIPHMNNIFLLKNNKKTYDCLKNVNIPTLMFYDIAKYNNRQVIIAENYNCRDNYIRVTSNYHPKKQLIEKYKSIFLNNNIKETIIECTNERNLEENKLNYIDNENQLKKELAALSKLCTKNKILITEDSIFFTVDKLKNRVFNPFIADFDCVQCDLKEVDNNDACDKALYEFKKHFVSMKYAKVKV